MSYNAITGYYAHQPYTSLLHQFWHVSKATVAKPNSWHQRIDCLIYSHPILDGRVEVIRFDLVCVHHCSVLMTITAFTLTRFGSVISSGTVTKRSVSRAEPCRTDPGWDLLTEPDQHGSVRLFGKCEHLYNRTNCFQSDERGTSGRAEFVIVSGEILRVSCERFLLQRYDRQRVDRQRSALPH